MGLEQLHLGGKNKVEFSIDLIQAYEPQDGYYLAFSGGKDSLSLRHLAVLAKVKFQSYYHPSPLDPPELIKFIREYFPDTIFEHPKMPFWQAFDKKGFPLRRKRWCCEYIKEWGGAGRTVLTGVRSEESIGRRHKCFVTFNQKSRTRFDKGQVRHEVAPLLLWTKQDVWAFLEQYAIPYPSLYDEGSSGKYKGDGEFQRIGCVMCPLAKESQRLIEYYRFPKIALAWQHGFDRLYLSKPVYSERWKTANEMFWWWMAPSKRIDNLQSSFL
jgi:phosphoadenosine phosphosulfate reductase